MVLRTENADDADIALVSTDGIKFRVRSAHLARASPDWFGDIFQSVDLADAARDQPLAIPLPNSSVVLDALLKLAHGLRAPLESLSIAELDQLLRAARTYRMHGPEQTILYEVRARLALLRNAQTADYLRVYVQGWQFGQLGLAYAAERHLHAAKLYGETLPEMPFNLVARLMRARAKRIDEFTTKLEDVDGIFGREYRAECRQCGDVQPTYVRQNWHQFVNDMATQFARHPSVDGAAAHEHVQSTIRTLACDCCRHCRQAMFPWARLREELLALADPPASPPQPPLILL